MRKFSEEHIRQMTDNAIANFCDTIPKRVEDALSGGMMTLLGLQKSFNEYRLDTSNRNSVLDAIVKKRVNAVLPILAEKMIDRGIMEMVRSTDALQAMIRHAKQIYRDAMQAKLNELVKKKAEEEAAAMFAEGITGMEAAFAKLSMPSDDIADPDSFKSKVGSLLMREIAEEMSKVELGSKCVGGVVLEHGALGGIPVLYMDPRIPEEVRAAVRRLLADQSVLIEEQEMPYPISWRPPVDEEWPKDDEIPF